MPNVTLYLLAAIAGLVALAGVGYKGYSLGADHVRAEYSARDLAAANEAAAFTKATEEKYRAKEQASAQALAQVANDYEGKLNAANTAKDTALNAIRSGGTPAVRPVEVAPPQLPPAPASVMVPRPANFQERLLNFLSVSPPKPTAIPLN